MIPSSEPQIRSADDWRARFGTVRSISSSRVGQIRDLLFADIGRVSGIGKALGTAGSEGFLLFYVPHILELVLDGAYAGGFVLNVLSGFTGEKNIL